MGVGERGIGEVAGTAAGGAVVGPDPSPVREPTLPHRSGIAGREAQDVARRAAAVAHSQAKSVLRILLPLVAPRARSRTVLAHGLAFPWPCRIVGSCFHLVVHERISSLKGSSGPPIRRSENPIGSRRAASCRG
jgi:hypothetical protein